jgi:hypothetical protein
MLVLVAFVESAEDVSWSGLALTTDAAKDELSPRFIGPPRVDRPWLRQKENRTAMSITRPVTPPLLTSSLMTPKLIHNGVDTYHAQLPILLDPSFANFALSLPTGRPRPWPLPTSDSTIHRHSSGTYIVSGTDTPSSFVTRERDPGFE